MTDRGGLLIRYAALLLALAAAAVNTGNNLLYLILSLMLALAAVSWFAGGRALRRIRPSLHLPGEAVAGRPFLVGVEVRNGPGRLPAAWASARLGGFPCQAEPIEIPSLPPGGRAVLTGEAVPERRGIHRDLEIHLTTRYPFGLFARRRRVAPSGELVVTPRRSRIRSVRVEAPAAAGASASRRPGEGADLYNIREYTRQDDARRIDWRASARLDRPMLKEFEHEQERVVEILVDERADPLRDAAAFETLVETAASLLDHCEEAGVRGRLLAPRAGGRADLLSGRAAMSWLAGVAPDPSAPGPAAAGPPAAGIPRIVLSLDPAARSRLHVEWAEPRAGPALPRRRERGAADAEEA